MVQAVAVAAEGARGLHLRFVSGKRNIINNGKKAIRKDGKDQLDISRRGAGARKDGTEQGQ